MKKRGGFSLLELVVVLCIIAILMSVVSVRLTGRIGEARELAITTDMDILLSAGEMYAARYPNEMASSQAALVEKGCLKEALPSPVDGYSYKVQVEEERVYVALIKGDEVYEKGSFKAEKSS